MSLSLQILIFAALMEAWNPLCYSHSCSQEGIGRLQFLPCLTRSFQRNEDTLNGSEVVWLVTSRCHETFKLMAAKRVSSLQKEFINVVWNLEEALEDGQQLFVSGSDNALGTWDPRLAIPMSSCNGKVNFWQPEIQVSWGTSFQYNYFVKHSNSATHSIRWRHGPAFCLSLPFSRRFMKKQIVQDRWVGCNEKANVSAHQINSTHVFSKSANHVLVSDSDVKSNDISTKQRASESLNLKDQPIEEPWLPVFPVASEEGPLSSILTKKSEAKSTTKETGTVETILDIEKEKKVKDMQRTALVNGSEDLLGDLEIDDTSGERPISVSEERVNKKDKKVNTEIIVNSSPCSIQRIAILEDGTPVELFLEPVKANVQLGNIYLGIVKRLLPCMSGAFVDIGDRQLAFLATSKNTKPFTFPPLNVYPKEVQVNGMSSKNSSVSSSSAEGGFGNFSDDIADDERSMNYDDALNENECIEDAFENVCNMEVGSVRENDLSSISGMHELVEPDFHENGFVPKTESQDDGHLQTDDDTEKEKSSTDLGNDKSIPSEWKFLKVGTKIVVQVIRESRGTKGPTVTAFPVLTSRFWVLETRQNQVAVSRKIVGPERTRLKWIAKKLHDSDFGMTVRSVAEGCSFEELSKDLSGLIETWNDIIEKAESAYMEAEDGVEDAVPVILKKAMSQTLLVVQDYFNENVQRMVVDSKNTFREVTRYLQGFSPSLVKRVELYNDKTPIFDKFGVENVIDYILSERVPLPNGGYLVIQQTEALVTIDVNGGSGMLGRNRSEGKGIESSKEQAILEVNLAAAKQIVRELRLRDIGGIIVVDFIDMEIEKHKRMVYEEVKKAVEQERFSITFSELSDLGLMEMTRRCVRPSVAFQMTEPCTCCRGSGRVEALDTTFSRIERAICRILVSRKGHQGIHSGSLELLSSYMAYKVSIHILNKAKRTPQDNATTEKSKPRVLLRVDRLMHDFLASGKKKRIVQLSKAFKVPIFLKVIRSFMRGQFEVAEDNTDIKPHFGIFASKNRRLRSAKQGQTLRTWSLKAKRSLKK